MTRQTKVVDGVAVAIPVLPLRAGRTGAQAGRNRTISYRPAEAGNQMYPQHDIVERKESCDRGRPMKVPSNPAFLDALGHGYMSNNLP